MALYHCPFCPFGDDDSQFLIQHVGLLHPESDDSPFIVKEGGKPKRSSAASAKESDPPRVAAAEDGYIECEW